jgi:hypothetical protein
VGDRDETRLRAARPTWLAGIAATDFICLAGLKGRTTTELLSSSALLA